MSTPLELSSLLKLSPIDLLVLLLEGDHGTLNHSNEEAKAAASLDWGPLGK